MNQRSSFRVILAAGLIAAIPLSVLAGPRLEFAYARIPYVLAVRCDFTQPLAFINLDLRNLGDTPTRPRMLEASDDAGVLRGAQLLGPIAPGGSAAVQIPLRRIDAGSGTLAGIHRITFEPDDHQLKAATLAIPPTFCGAAAVEGIQTRDRGFPIVATDTSAVESPKIESRVPTRAQQFAAISKLPRRVYRLRPDEGSSTGAVRRPALTTTAGVAAAQSVTAHDATLQAIEANGCATHALLLQNVIGELTPGGTLIASGACFGPDPGELQVVGNFPNSNGVVKLAVQSWTDTAVTAKVPAITNAPDQAADVRLERHVSTMRVRPKTGVPEIYSAPVRMSFLARREIVEAVRSVANESCAPGDQPSTDLCNEGLCGWSICDFGNHAQKGPDSGTDTWRAHFPPGWRFDHIEVQGQAQVVIDPTIDPTNVTWSVRWQTLRTRTEATHVGNQYTYSIADDGSYLTFVYASGAIGTYPYK